MDWLRRLLFPEPARELRHQRACNIAFRTVHIAATGILLGGHVFDVEESRLRGSLYLSIATGLGLLVLEAYPSLRWIYQGRGVMVLSKLALLLRRAVPLGQPRADSAGRLGDRIGRVAHAVAVPLLLVRASPGARAPESGESRWGLNRPTGPLGAKELEHGQQLAVGAGILLEGVRHGLPHPSVPILTAVAVKTPSVQEISKKP